MRKSPGRNLENIFGEGGGVAEEGRRGGTHRRCEGVAGRGRDQLFFFFHGQNVHQHLQTRRPCTRGQNPQNWQKRVEGSKNSHFPSFQKRVLRVKKSPFSLWCPVEKWGFSDSNCPFPGSWEVGVLRL